ncbi:hypothetical protein [Nesterenkonia halotolerans]|uniref:LPXTG cell wall anchor domain-containing protein n=1 Tax=Nesterenkonia halotolerans TaxID=225325 RepID=A0ABR9J6G2_9MICC|nr:hypothetical protein [Nesterenkonia halotolerans]MBE1514578.1 hypothetical protein [Nesterenkonia halotolerans]
MTVPFALTAGAATADGLPEWTPLVFGLVSLLVVTLVIVLARRKMNESQRWRNGTDSNGPDTNGPDSSGPAEPGDDSRRNDGA